MNFQKNVEAERFGILRISVIKFKMAITILSKAGAALAGAISAVIVGNELGQKDLGYFALIRIVPALFVLLTEFGISNSYTFLINRLRFDSFAVYRAGIFSILCVVAFQIFCWSFLCIFIKITFFSDFPISWVLWIGILAPLQVIHLHVVNLLRAVGETKNASVVFISIELAILFLLITVLQIDKLSILYVLAVVIFSYFIVAFSGVIFLGLKGYRPVPLLDVNIFKKSLSYGMKAQIGNAALILNYRLDHILIAAFLGVNELAIYTVASKGAEIFRFFATSINFVLEPFLATKSIETARITVQEKYIKVFIANIIFVLIGVVSIPFVVPILFGAWADSSIVPFYILAAGMMVSGSNGLVSAYNFSIGLPRLNTNVILVGLFAAVSLATILIPYFGMSGAAWATTLTQILITILYFLQFHYIRFFPNK